MTYPFVSVIVPVYNDSVRLKQCLNALERQDFPRSRYEIIVIDNNSDEDIEKIVKDFSQICYLFEASPGSYSARNKGIASAKGEILAFIDSDCLPQPHWLVEGIKALKERNADLAGGQVTFTFSKKKEPAELHDSVSNMQIKDNIKNRKISKTANLFVRQHVFDSVGLFPSYLKSGGDVVWTKRATDAKFKLVYAPNAEVFHPARTLLPLLQKQYRVGLGQPHVLREQKQTTTIIIKGALKYILFPPSFQKTKALYKKKNMTLGADVMFSVWLVNWLCQATMGVGRINKLTMEALSPDKSTEK